MLVVRGYNQIIHSINPKYKNLFKQHLGDLDRYIELGIYKYTFGSNCEMYFHEARELCQKLFEKVKKFQKASKQFNEELHRVGSTVLTNIGKDFYMLSDFLREQNAIISERQQKLLDGFNRITDLMMDTYELFMYQKGEIQSEWLGFVHSIDKSLHRTS